MQLILNRKPLTCWIIIAHPGTYRSYACSFWWSVVKAWLQLVPETIISGEGRVVIVLGRVVDPAAASVAGGTSAWGVSGASVAAAASWGTGSLGCLGGIDGSCCNGGLSSSFSGVGLGLLGGELNKQKHTLCLIDILWIHVHSFTIVELHNKSDILGLNRGNWTGGK